ncbi:hypothetical protein BFG07_04835 [Kosakonia cowanii]|nr:hypothetical protein BFG07_04835 [Kosakonia cowanii]
MMLFLDTPGRCFTDRLQDEVKGYRRSALKDTSRTENESRSGWTVDQEDPGHALRIRPGHIGVV